MEERTAELLERGLHRVLDQGLPLHEAGDVTVFGGDVQALVGFAQSLQTALAATPDVARKAAARSRFLVAAAQQQPQPRFDARWFVWSLFKPALAFSLALVVVTYGVLQTLASALPGDLLYPVKLNAEQVSLALTLDPKDKAARHLELAEKRTDEVAALVQQGRPVLPEALSLLAQETARATASLDLSNSLVLTDHLASIAAKQQEVLTEVAQSVPPQASGAVQEALEASRLGLTAAQASRQKSEEGRPAATPVSTAVSQRENSAGNSSQTPNSPRPSQNVVAPADPGQRDQTEKKSEQSQPDEGKKSDSGQSQDQSVSEQRREQQKAAAEEARRKAEAEGADREARAKAELERQKQQERQAQGWADREARAKAEADRKEEAQRQQEKQAQVQADKEARAKAEADRKEEAQRQQEKQAQEQADKEARAKAEADRKEEAQRQQEKQAQEQADKEARAKTGQEANRADAEQKAQEKQAEAEKPEAQPKQDDGNRQGQHQESSPKSSDGGDKGKKN